MPHRTFLDGDGTEWTVWDVHPTVRERLPQVAESLRTGWLALRSSDVDRRRIAPIPDGWHEWTDEQLRVLLGHAEPRPAMQRLVE
jgi:hypothetical protein